MVMRREKMRGEAGKKYRGPTVRKGCRGSSRLHVFLSFSVVRLFIERTNKLLRRCLSRCETENQGRAHLFSYAAINILCKDFLAGLALLGGSKRKFYRSSKPPSVAQDIPSRAGILY